MRWFRVPLVALMGLVVIVALDLAIIQVLLRSKMFVQTTLTPQYTMPQTHLGASAMGVLPMASLLTFLLLVRVPKLIQREESSSFLVGFEVFGWLSVVGFMVGSVFWPLAAGQSFRYASNLAGLILEPMLRHLPDWLWLEVVYDLGLISVTFGIPELAFALLGGWLIRRAGISVRIDRHRAIKG